MPGSKATESGVCNGCGVSRASGSQRLVQDDYKVGQCRSATQDRFPESMRTMEPYHELGCPALERLCGVDSGIAQH